MSRRLKFCQATNSAGRRCEYRVKRHPEQDGRPLHRRGDVTWNEPRGHTASRAIFDETFTFNAQFKTPPNSKSFFDSLIAGDGGGRPLGILGEHHHVSIGGHDVTGLVSGIDFHGTPEFGEDRFSYPPTPRDQLAAWWREKAEAEIGQTVDKAVEYGATDLIDIGRNIARLSDREVTDQEAALMGVFFYLEGKFARWRSALHEGRPVSHDTLLDIGVYVRMAQRIAEVGSWPGVNLEDK